MAFGDKYAERVTAPITSQVTGRPVYPDPNVIINTARTFGTPLPKGVAFGQGILQGVKQGIGILSDVNTLEQQEQQIAINTQNQRLNDLRIQQEEADTKIRLATVDSSISQKQAESELAQAKVISQKKVSDDKLAFATALNSEDPETIKNALTTSRFSSLFYDPSFKVVAKQKAMDALNIPSGQPGALDPQERKKVEVNLLGQKFYDNEPLIQRTKEAEAELLSTVDLGGYLNNIANPRARRQAINSIQTYTPSDDERKAAGLTSAEFDKFVRIQTREQTAEGEKVTNKLFPITDDATLKAIQSTKKQYILSEQAGLPGYGSGGTTTQAQSRTGSPAQGGATSSTPSQMSFEQQQPQNQGPNNGFGVTGTPRAQQISTGEISTQARTSAPPPTPRTQGEQLIKSAVPVQETVTRAQGTNVVTETVPSFANNPQAEEGVKLMLGLDSEVADAHKEDIDTILTVAPKLPRGIVSSFLTTPTSEERSRSDARALDTAKINLTKTLSAQDFEKQAAENPQFRPAWEEAYQNYVRKFVATFEGSTFRPVPDLNAALSNIASAEDFYYMKNSPQYLRTVENTISAVQTAGNKLINKDKVTTALTEEFTDAKQNFRSGNQIPTEPSMEKKNSEVIEIEGTLSARHESGGNVAVIAPDVGGKAYGVFQIHSKYTMPEYLKESRYREELNGLDIGSSEFDRKWKEISERDPENFASDQRNFILNKKVKPVVREANFLGFNTRDEGVAETLFSIGVQHRNYKQILQQALKTSEDAGDPASQVRALYRARREYVMSLNLSSQIKDQLSRRYETEEREALALTSEGRGIEAT